MEITIPIFYMIDEKTGKKIIDEESMRQEFENQIDILIKKYEANK